MALQFASRAKPIFTWTVAAAFAVASTLADACTRAFYLGTNGIVITARSMDWETNILSNHWIFPRGMARTGETGPSTIKWTSKYGSVIVSGFDISTTDNRVTIRHYQATTPPFPCP